MTFLERIFPAIILVFTGPIIAEYLLGGIPIHDIDRLMFVGPIYGFGALLVREITRQTGRGWPTIIALGFIYAVIEEGIACQTLFNPNFANMHLLDYGYIPALGMGSVYTILVISLHIIWSICVPIGLVELLFVKRRTEPWLGKIGLGVSAVLYAVGVAILTAFFLLSFSAQPFQYGIVAAMLLIGLAVTFLVSRSGKAAPPLPGAAPSPWLLGVLAFLGTSIMWLLWFGAGHPIPEQRCMGCFAERIFPLPATATALIILTLDVIALIFIFTSARREGWSNMHRFALVAGALATYFWLGIYQLSVRDVVITGQIGLVAVFIAILVFVAGKLRTNPHTAS